MPEQNDISPEIARLKTDLDRYAVSQGYPDVASSLPIDLAPDVLRYDPKTKMLFVGDTQNGTENQTVIGSETINRALGCVAAHAGLLQDGIIDGGIIAFATNDESVANNWKEGFQLLFCSRSFTVKKLDGKNTWVVWC